MHLQILFIINYKKVILIDGNVYAIKYKIEIIHREGETIFKVKFYFILLFYN